VINKGLVSYRDPESAPGRGQKTLNVTRDMDLTKLIVKCLRELGDSEGATLPRIENRVRNLYVVQVSRLARLKLHEIGEYNFTCKYFSKFCPYAR
jgi:hypothetical protein